MKSIKIPLSQGWAKDGLPKLPHYHAHYQGTANSEQIDYAKTMFTPNERKRLNGLAVIVNILVPWVVYCVIVVGLSFSSHYSYPYTVWTIPMTGIVIAKVVAVKAWLHRQKDSEPLWLTFCAISIVCATIAATVVGDWNFWTNMYDFYHIQGMNTYVSVNPSSTPGSTMMDAGRIYFAEGSHLDYEKTMGFRSGDEYCVVPVVNDKYNIDQRHRNWDTWAVGVNCCSEPAYFRCGQVDNPMARSGMRLLDNNLNTHFRLAVKQAEAAYGIKAIHPVFFHWVQDPLYESNQLRREGYKWSLVSSCIYLVCQAFATVTMCVLFGRIARY